jgi:peptide/nickel transport system permease protein
MYWLKTIACRVALLTVTVIAGGLISATLVRYAPGFGADEQQLDARLSNESIQVLKDASEKERSILSYYVGSIAQMLKGDLGTSRSFQRPVRELLVERTAVTVRMVGAGLAVAWFLSLMLVVIMWLSGSRAFDSICTVGSGSLLCVPAGVIALLLVLLNGPGYVALALVVSPKVHRYLSGLVRATARMPHILAARSRGVSEGGLLARHVAPVIGREVLALGGVSVALAISAAIPVEALCGIPGIGQLAWHAAMARDLPLLIYVSLLVIAFTVLANSGAEVLTAERRQSL